MTGALPSVSRKGTVQAVLFLLRSQGSTHFCEHPFCEVKSRKSASLDTVFAKMAHRKAVIAETAMEADVSPPYNNSSDL